jgi:excinuclease UvrABC ATPase subunit
VVITGLSGSGKSSLAFDTIYAEGSAATSSRLLVRASSSSRWRSRTSIHRGLSPAIAIEQRTTDRTRVHRRHRHRDLRLPAAPFANIGVPPAISADAIASQSLQRIIDMVMLS